MTLNLDKSAWKRVVFGEVVANINDYFAPERDGVLPYVAGPHIAGHEPTVGSYGATDDEKFPPTFKRKFRPGDVLLHSRGIEKLAAVDRDGVTGEKLFVLRSLDGDVLLQEYLLWLLLSPEAQAHMSDNFTGSVNKFLNWKPLAAFEFDLPPLEEQKRIADLLWAAERHRRSVAATREALRRAADDLFGFALTSHEANRIPAPQLIEEMTVGVVVRPTQYYTDAADGVPALRGVNIMPGRFDLSDLVRFEPSSAADLTKSTLREGDVVVVRTGRPGDAAAVTSEVAGFNCIDLIITRPGPRLDPGFFARYLNSSYGRSQVIRLSAGTAQQHFNVGALKKLEIPVLTRDEQRDLMERVGRVDRALEAKALEQAAVVALTASLLSQIFGGS